MNRRGCFPENVIYKQPVGRFPYRPQSADPWARGKGDDEKIWRVQTKGTHPGRRYYYYSIHGLEPGHKVSDGARATNTIPGGARLMLLFHHNLNTRHVSTRGKREATKMTWNVV